MLVFVPLFIVLALHAPDAPLAHGLAIPHMGRGEAPAFFEQELHAQQSHASGHDEHGEE